MKTTKKSDKNATKTTKIAYPKANVTVLEQATKEITNSLQGTINSSYSQTNLYQENERLKQQIDEIKTNQLSSQNTSSGASVDLTEIENAISKNSSDIEALQSTKQNNLTAGSNIGITNNVISANFDTSGLQSQITNLQSTKQDTLVAGSNISIINNTISATNTKYTAGQNITIENGVINAIINQSGDKEMNSNISKINTNIAKIREQIAICSSKIAGEETEYDQTITRNYDKYERELEIVGTKTIDTPSVLFATYPYFTKVEDGQSPRYPITINYQVELKIKANQQDNISFLVYDNDFAIYEGNIQIQSANQEQTQSFSTYFASSTDSHCFYITFTSTNSSTQITLKNLSLEVVAPNVTVLNKIEPFNVTFNYYTNKYYLSDCSTGYLKTCEIDANNLTSTGDIVWNNTDIEAQSYNTYFIGETDNTSSQVGKQYAILTLKNNTVKIVDLYDGTLSYTFPVGTFKVEPIMTKRDFSQLYYYTINKNVNMLYYCELSQSMILSNQTGCGIRTDVADFYAIKNNNNYLSYASSYLGYMTLFKNGTAQYVLSRYAGTTQIAKDFDFVDDTKIYMDVCYDSSKFDYTVLVKQYNNYYSLSLSYVYGTYTWGNPILLGEYDNLFIGANNNFFAVSNGEIIFIPNQA